MKSVFDHSKAWRLESADDQPYEEDILRRRTYCHASNDARLHARAYRGAAIRRCLADFEDAIASQAFEMVVYIGHNGLMDFELPPPPKAEPRGRRPDVVVLCCKSQSYFSIRVELAGGRPVLTTTQFMYPGSFILEAAADGWLRGAPPRTLRELAANAYAANQNISPRAALGVFAAPPVTPPIRFQKKSWGHTPEKSWGHTPINT